MSQLKCQLILLAFLFVFYQHNVGVESLPQKRIVNGLNATAKQFPYQVYLDTFQFFKWYPTCGGVIISQRKVLTAAHCISDSVQAVDIYFGAVDKSNASETGQQKLRVGRKNIVVHPAWDSNQILNDIAVIVLPADLHFNKYIQPAKLPDPNVCYDNKMAVVSGWGVTDPLTGGSLSVLQYYNVPVLSTDACIPLLHQFYPGLFFPASWICLTPSESAPCFGDSGGPLAIKNADGSSTLLGLTSFGTDALCSVNRTDVYTRVSSFVSWINDCVSDNDYCSA